MAKLNTANAAVPAPVPGAADGDGKDNEYNKWDAENDMRTLVDHKKIMADPKRLKHATRAAKEKMAEMQHIKALASGKHA